MFKVFHLTILRLFLINYRSNTLKVKVAHVILAILIKRVKMVRI